MVPTSYSNARQMVFPALDSEYCVAAADENAGRGWTIQNLHCSEVARWGRGGEEALASLRAAVVPGGEIVLESTPNGAGGLFYEEWQRAPETGYSRHFFPWWFEPSYKKNRGKTFPAFTPEEQELIRQHGLTPGQRGCNGNRCGHWRHRSFRKIRCRASGRRASVCSIRKRWNGRQRRRVNRSRGGIIIDCWSGCLHRWGGSM